MGFQETARHLDEHKDDLAFSLEAGVALIAVAAGVRVDGGDTAVLAGTGGGAGGTEGDARCAPGTLYACCISNACAASLYVCVCCTFLLLTSSHATGGGGKAAQRRRGRDLASPRGTGQQNSPALTPALTLTPSQPRGGACFGASVAQPRSSGPQGIRSPPLIGAPR